MFKGPTLIVLLNTLAGLAVVGILAYSQFVFHRPSITEDQQREKIASEQEIQVSEGQSGMITFDPLNVSLKSSVSHDGGVKKEKQHFANVTLVLELKDTGLRYKFDAIRPIFMDRLIAHFGKKEFETVTSVQGRYLLRNEIVTLANELVKEPIFMNAFFNQFVVQ